MSWEELRPLLAEAQANPILPPDMAADLEERVAERRQGGTVMKVGDLVTEREAPEGELPWMARVDRIGAAGGLGSLLQVGIPDGQAGMTCLLHWSSKLRPLTDDEALALAAWLVTGDPSAEWEWCDEGARVLAHVDDPDTALWSCPEGEWAVYVPGQEDSIAHGRAPTDRSRRVAASRAFLAHLCGGAHD